jgi:hypothetical protein
MRILGVILFLLGAAGAATSFAASFERPRPLAVLFALLAPVAVLVALLGALLLFVPGFFSAP